jgi:heme-degrading monooxygenase HmoA
LQTFRATAGVAQSEHRRRPLHLNFPGDLTVVILEFALISIRPGSEAEFEQVFPVAEKVLAASPGYLSHELRRSIETPNRFALLVQWRTLEDHTEGFRGSPAFAQWRGLIGPFFDSPPVVEHFAPVAVAQV